MAKGSSPAVSEAKVNLLFEAQTEIDALASRLGQLGVVGLVLHVRWDDARTSTMGVAIDPQRTGATIAGAPEAVAKWSREVQQVPKAVKPLLALPGAKTIVSA